MFNQKIINVKTILLFLFAFASGIFSLSGQNLTSAPWYEYIGSHYDAEPWAGWVRDYTHFTATGSYMLDTNLTEGQLDTVIANSLVNKLYTDMLTLPTHYDATLQASQLGRELPGVNLYMSRIEADSGAMWRELCKLQAIKLTELPDGKNRIFWQIGNEISSPTYSRLLNLRAGNSVPCNGNGCDYDPFIIPVYAEYYFAPSVQGINEASMQLYGSNDSINIILGSLTNAGGNAAFNWLESLLNYTIEGTYAPGLTGKKVYELVDIVSIHYMMGNSNSSAWKTWIDKYRDTWFGVGKIKGIWSTEEVGIRAAEKGQGPVRGAAATSRYLEWAITNNYSPYQCRTNYWAHWEGPEGVTVNELNQEIFDFLGESRLSLVGAEKITYDNQEVESHAFLSADSTKGIIFTLLMSPAQSGSVSEIEITDYGMGNISDITSHYFSPSGHQIIYPDIEKDNDTFIINMNTSCALDSGKAVLVTLIQTQPLNETTDVQTELANKDDVVVYPNPTDNSLYISSQIKIKEIIIYNSLSRPVMSINLNKNDSNVDVTSLNRGLYILTVELENGRTIYKKVILQ